MELTVKTLDRDDYSSKIQVSDEVFFRKYNEALVHQVIVTYVSNSHQGSKAQKSRSEVSGGGIKPWKQKGTGRARAGTIRSPLWRKGGVTFAAKPKVGTKKINRKMYKLALQVIFSKLLQEERLSVIFDLKVVSRKTKDFILNLRQLDLFIQGKLLIIVDVNEFENLLLASRNIPNVTLVNVNSLNPVLLLSYEKVVVTKLAIKQIEERLS